MSNTIAVPDNFTEGFERLAEARDGKEPGWLSELRQAAFQRFVELGFPTTRHEDWKYTNVNPIVEAGFTRAEEPVSVSQERINDFGFEGLDAHLMVFVDGFFVPGLSHIGDLPGNVRVSSLAEALEKEPETVRRHIGQYADYQSNPFTALNIANSADGAFLFLPRGAVVEKPIHLVYIASAGEQPGAAYTHNLIVAEANSQVSVIENYVSLGEGKAFTSPLTEVAADESAVIDFYKIQREAKSVYHVGGLAVYQKESSMFRSHTVTFGGALTRNDVFDKLDGEGAEGIVNGLTVLSGDQHASNWMWIEHCKENIPSHELFKNVLGDKASAEFTGRIYVHPEAQKTDAKQTNQSLLLSRDARANARPQLEIYADDVKCTHGATIGELDDVALFYLRSRGLPQKEAQNLLVRAFAADLIERIKIEPLKKAIEDELIARLPKV